MLRVVTWHPDGFKAVNLHAQRLFLAPRRQDRPSCWAHSSRACLTSTSLRIQMERNHRHPDPATRIQTAEGGWGNVGGLVRDEVSLEAARRSPQSSSLSTASVISQVVRVIQQMPPSVAGKRLFSSLGDLLFSPNFDRRHVQARLGFHRLRPRAAFGSSLSERTLVARHDLR